MDDAIVVSNLWKTFKLPHEKRNTLFESFKGILDSKNGYEEFVALKNINFTVKKGEAIGIIGENGSGKSTLLKIVANILRPSRGSIKINGRITPFLELGVGFQPDHTAKENIYIYGAIMGLSDKEIDAKLDKILEFSGLKRFEDTKLKNFSSGMQVRLAFATAIQTNPEILLMDEVLAVGDMEFQQKCLDVFQRYIKEKKTIVFVSHDLNSIRRFCGKALLLRHGEQVAFGGTNEIIDKYVYGAGDTEKHAVSEPKIEQLESTEAKISKPKFDKKIEILDVKFFDKYEKENKNFVSGDTMEIKIYYNASVKIKEPRFGVIIYSDDGICCYITNTELKDFKIGPIYGKGILEFKIEKIPMIEGKFLVTTASYSKDYKINHDWHDRRYSFHVVKNSTSLGLFEIPSKWNHGEINSNE
jgi:lipopolysaccharide transport system ATP-binding protein